MDTKLPGGLVDDVNGFGRHLFVAGSMAPGRMSVSQIEINHTPGLEWTLTWDRR